MSKKIAPDLATPSNLTGNVLKNGVDAPARDNATSVILDTWTDFAERPAGFLFEATRPA